MSEGLGLAELLTAIVIPDGESKSGRFHVRPISGAEGHYVGRDSSGRPCILLSATNGSVRAPIRLEAIEARFAVPCRITIENHEQQETLTVVVCTTPNSQSQSYFIHVCETIIRIVGQNPSLDQVVDAVQRLVDLFRRLSQPASRPLIGLLGELFIISRSSNPEIAVRAWRSSQNDRFDFSVDDIRLEVKASGDRTRAHSFSAEQCSPPPEILGVAASIFIEGSGGGISLLELIQSLEHRLVGKEELILKVQETVADTLGDTLSVALSMRFDERLARSSLQFYDLSTIPAVRLGIPSEVTQVRFRSDLSHTPTFSIEELGTRNARIMSFLPTTI